MVTVRETVTSSPDDPASSDLLAAGGVGSSNLVGGARKLLAAEVLQGHLVALDVDQKLKVGVDGVARLVM